ncbi:MAG: hypothetical protein AAF645_15795 [Myxococcota bacterium]
MHPSHSLLADAEHLVRAPLHPSTNYVRPLLMAAVLLLIACSPAAPPTPTPTGATAGDEDPGENRAPEDSAVRVEVEDPCTGLEIDFSESQGSCPPPPPQPAPARAPEADRAQSTGPFGHRVHPHLNVQIDDIDPVPSGERTSVTLRIVNESAEALEVRFTGCILPLHTTRHPSVGGFLTGTSCNNRPFLVTIAPGGAVRHRVEWEARYDYGPSEPLPVGEYEVGWKFLLGSVPGVRELYVASGETTVRVVQASNP